MFFFFFSWLTSHLKFVSLCAFFSQRFLRACQRGDDTRFVAYQLFHSCQARWLTHVAKVMKVFGWRMIQVHWHGWKDLVRCRFACQLLHGTVDGRNPALVDRYFNIPWFAGFHTCWCWVAVWDFFHQQYLSIFFPPILTSSKSAAWQIWPPMHFSKRDDRRVAEVEDQSGLFRTWQILILGSKFLPVQIILKITSPAKSVSVIFEGGFCPQLRFLICSFSFLADQNSKMCPDFVVFSNFPSNFPYQQGDIYMIHRRVSIPLTTEMVWNPLI